MGIGERREYETFSKSIWVRVQGMCRRLKGSVRKWHKTKRVEFHLLLQQTRRVEKVKTRKSKRLAAPISTQPLPSSSSSSFYRGQKKKKRNETKTNTHTHETHKKKKNRLVSSNCLLFLGVKILSKKQKKRMGLWRRWNRNGAIVELSKCAFVATPSTASEYNDELRVVSPELNQLNKSNRKSEREKRVGEANARRQGTIKSSRPCHINIYTNKK